MSCARDKRVFARLDRPPRVAVQCTYYLFPCSTRLWHKLTSVRAVGQKKECSTWSVGFGVYRRQTPIYTITLFSVGRTPITANPIALSEVLVQTEYNGFRVVLSRSNNATAAHTSAPVAASTVRVVGPQTTHPRGHIPCSALRGPCRGLGPGGSW